MRIFPVAASFILACATNSPLTPLRGELAPDHPNKPLTVIECGTGRVYELGVMADTLYFHFISRVEELRSADPSAPILVELQGEKAEPTASIAQRGAQGVFYLRSFPSSSMRHGDCAVGEARSGLAVHAA